MICGLLWYEKEGFNSDRAMQAYYKRFGYMPNVVYCKNNFECKITVKTINCIPDGHYILSNEGDEYAKENEKALQRALAF